MSYTSNINFEVNSEAILSGIINGEIQARMSCKAQNIGNPEGYQKKLQKYKEAGIINSTPSVVNFMRKYPTVFQNPKLISYRNGNIFEEITTLSPLAESDSYDTRVKNRMTIGHGLTDEEMEGMDDFIKGFHDLANSPDIKPIIEETKAYRRKVERTWRSNEESIMKHIYNILGYEPENTGRVSTYIMYPNYDTHRSCQLSDNRTFLFLGKRGKDADNKILAHLSHQAVHQPMLPYKLSMSKQDKQEFHGFIKFLTDKEIYSTLTGKSYLDITTPQENHQLMAKLYPFWLGYRYRFASREGLDSAELIDKAIQRDKAYYESLPKDSKKRKAFEHYQFDSLDPQKIADFFRYKKGITPYEFVKLDFNNKSLVCKGETNQKRENPETDEWVQ